MLLGRSPRLRAIAGFAIAPLAPALLLAIVLLAIGGEHATETLQYTPYAAFVSYPIALLFGAPAFFVMRRRHWNGWRAYLVAGVLLGLLFFLLSLVSMEGGLVEHILATLPFALTGAVAASLVFWAIARPDRTGGDSDQASRPSA
ncbi:MAG: hypothetical protein JSR90_16595 [Proteobacteria bacterium]|nr:hypothetical protein [Pseudomonadota bacterium]